eukprot:TRINITY_DN127988_c0_g1_i1.p1 TRINITY_DN127988_c0_g1~~TRINITY_DN127988_c0_g1_i1.p1  ORF type:complete len:191 (+),score=9.08 TRINITY_DN127988_c0_g1_i1:49-573(+)
MYVAQIRLSLEDVAPIVLVFNLGIITHEKPVPGWLELPSRQCLGELLLELLGMALTFCGEPGTEQDLAAVRAASILLSTRQIGQTLDPFAVDSLSETSAAYMAWVSQLNFATSAAQWEFVNACLESNNDLLKHLLSAPVCRVLSPQVRSRLMGSQDTAFLFKLSEEALEALAST